MPLPFITEFLCLNRKVNYVEAEQVSTKKRIVRAGISFVACVAVTYAFHRLLASPGSRGLSTEEYLVDAVIAAGVDFFSSDSKAYEVEVDDEVIRVHRGDSYNKQVRRGHIRYIREVAGNLFRRSALKLPEHGPIYSFFLGCVWIPTTVPDYEQIKARAMSWRAIG